MRRGWVLALLAACATERREVAPQPADSGRAEEVRRFVQENSILVEVAEIPEPVAAVGADRFQGECIYAWGRQARYDFLSVVERAGFAEVVHIRMATPFMYGYGWRWRLPHRDPDEAPEPRTPGSQEVQHVHAWRATIPRADFEALIGKVALMQCARLRTLPREKPEPTVGFGNRGSAPSEVFVLRVGDDPPIRGFCRAGDPVDRAPGERDRLTSGIVWSEAARWTFEKVHDAGLVAPQLLSGLADMPDSWQRDARVTALGFLGCAGAVPVLQKLEPREPHVAEALTRIRLLQLCEAATRAPQALVDLANSEEILLGPWAFSVLGQRFPEDCRALLLSSYDTQDREVRDRALSQLHNYDPSDSTLARRARDDPDPLLRVRGAHMLGDWRFLLAMACDKALPTDARSDALARLTEPETTGRRWIEPIGDRQVVGPALVAILRDPTDGLNEAAPHYLAELGYREAVPVLIETLHSSRARHSYNLGAFVAVALGEFRAKEAVEPLIKELERGHTPLFLRNVAVALARIGDPRGLPVIEKQTRIDRDFRSSFTTLDVFEAIRTRSPNAILETWDGSPRLVAELLAESLSADELRALAEDRDLLGREAILEHALALKEGRG